MAKIFDWNISYTFANKQGFGRRAQPATLPLVSKWEWIMGGGKDGTHDA